MTPAKTSCSQESKREEKAGKEQLMKGDGEANLYYYCSQLMSENKLFPQY